MSELKKKIIVVDDEKSIVKFLVLMLKNSVDEILEAYNGKEAFHLLKNNPDTALVLSDIKMPVMDGLELIKKTREKGLSTPFIFFTGFGCQKYMVEALKYGAYDFIDKPNLENLEEVVKKCLKETQGQREKNKNLLNEEYGKMVKK